MKEFRKTKNNEFICEECERTFHNYQGLRTHIRHSHSNLSQKNYYDKWLKDENDGKCKICEISTRFDSLLNGYKECCNIKHTNLNAYKKKSLKMKNKFGVENQFQREDIKEKCKQKHIENLSVEYPRQSYIVVKKSKQTCKEKYGDENYNNSEKRRNTCLEKYGYEHPNQIIEQYNKGLKTRLLIHQFKDTNLWYQGSYELDFLEKYYDKFSEIKRGPSIKYKFEGKYKFYHSDFYIPLLNLIIEIKNHYLAQRDKEEIKSKEKATITDGFNYIMIIDKDYTNFKKLFG